MTKKIKLLIDDVCLEVDILEEIYDLAKLALAQKASELRNDEELIEKYLLRKIKQSSFSEEKATKRVVVVNTDPFGTMAESPKLS